MKGKDEVCNGLIDCALNFPKAVLNQCNNISVMNMEAIFAVTNTTKAVVKIRSKKKIQACTGFEPMTSTIPVQHSTNWAGHYVGYK